MTQFLSQTIKNDLLKDFNAVVHEGEQLLKSVVDEGGDKLMLYALRWNQI